MSQRRGRDPRKTTGSPARQDASAEARRAGWQDRDERVYAKKRARQSRERARQERREFDPTPPSDDDWTLPEPDTSGIRRISAPTPIGDSLQAFIARRGWDERLRGATAWSRWDEIVGPELATRCEPVRLAGGTLVIRAESQAWATQLRYLTTQLLVNARSVLGEDGIRELRLTVGPLEGRTAPET